MSSMTNVFRLTLVALSLFQDFKYLNHGIIESEYAELEETRQDHRVQLLYINSFYLSM